MSEATGPTDHGWALAIGMVFRAAREVDGRALQLDSDAWDAILRAAVRFTIDALRGKDALEAAEFAAGIKAHPEHWDGWPYAHPYGRAADYLEGLSQ